MGVYGANDKVAHSPEYSKARAVGEKHGSFRIFAVDACRSELFDRN
jgi:hypothetical protein